MLTELASVGLLLASVLVFLLLLYGTLRQMNLSYVLVLVGEQGSRGDRRACTERRAR